MVCYSPHAVNTPGRGGRGKSPQREEVMIYISIAR